jgi:hypothetical protein
VAPPVQEQAQIINLMDALRQSVNKVKGGAEEASKPPKKVARSERPAKERRKPEVLLTRSDRRPLSPTGAPF